MTEGSDARDEPAGNPAEPGTAAETKAPWWIRHYTFFGTAVGLLFLWFSLTPSLLPRGPLFQGLVSGAAGAIGYGLGVFGVWLVRYMRSHESSPPAPRRAWIALVAVGVIGLRWHYFTDTVAGAAVGIGTVCALALVLDLPTRRRRPSVTGVSAGG